jgi:3-hydroxyisobutyrate dehydrogenase
VLDVAGVLYLRCTVSGNNRMAEAAQLTVMASGPRAAYDAALPLLKLLGPAQFWLGEGEQARLMKLVVNLMIAQTSAMLAEALALGRKGGLRWDDLWAVIGASAVASPIVKAKAQQLVQRDFTPTFTVAQMVKDLGLIVDAAADVHVPVPQTAATLQLMHAAIAQGDGGDDYAAIIKAVERAAGLETRP